MTRVALISDTHGYLCPRSLQLISECDEVWHAGDIGSEELLDTIEKTRPLRAVWGNIDGTNIKSRVPKVQRFEIEGLDVMITHIGGYPGKYEPEISKTLLLNPPKLLVCGHSHIHKVMNDNRYKLLYMNPGAIGKYGFHVKRTMLIFEIEHATCKNLRIVEWDK